MECDIESFMKYSDGDEYHETYNSPMHPILFYTLSDIESFSIINGYTYKEYIEIWKSRYKVTDIDKIDVIIIDNNKPYKKRLINKAYVNYHGNIMLPNNCYTYGIYERIFKKELDDIPYIND